LIEGRCTNVPSRPLANRINHDAHGTSRLGKAALQPSQEPIDAGRELGVAQLSDLVVLIVVVIPIEPRAEKGTSGFSALRFQTDGEPVKTGISPFRRSEGNPADGRRSSTDKRSRLASLTPLRSKSNGQCLPAPSLNNCFICLSSAIKSPAQGHSSASVAAELVAIASPSRTCAIGRSRPSPADALSRSGITGESH
jgi:hypothetical protein